MELAPVPRSGDEEDAAALSLPPAARSAYFRLRRWNQTFGRNAILMLPAFALGGFLVGTLYILPTEELCEYTDDPCVSIQTGFFVLLLWPFALGIFLCVATIFARIGRGRRRRRLTNSPLRRLDQAKEWFLHGDIEHEDLVQIRHGMRDQDPSFARRAWVAAWTLSVLALLLIINGVIWVITALAFLFDSYYPEYALAYTFLAVAAFPSMAIALQALRAVPALRTAARRRDDEASASLETLEDQVLRRNRARLGHGAPPPLAPASSAAAPTFSRATYARRR